MRYPIQLTTPAEAFGLDVKIGVVLEDVPAEAEAPPPVILPADCPECPEVNCEEDCPQECTPSCEGWRWSMGAKNVDSNNMQVFQGFQSCADGPATIEIGKNQFGLYYRFATFTFVAKVNTCGLRTRIQSGTEDAGLYDYILSDAYINTFDEVGIVFSIFDLNAIPNGTKLSLALEIELDPIGAFGVYTPLCCELTLNASKVV